MPQVWPQRDNNNNNKYPGVAEPSAQSPPDEGDTKTYWILGAEPGALEHAGRLRLSCVGLELPHLQRGKWRVPEPQEQGLTPGLLGGGGAGWVEASGVLLSALDFSAVTLRGAWF